MYLVVVARSRVDRLLRLLALAEARGDIAARVIIEGRLARLVAR